MNQPEQRLEFLIRDLPSPDSARRFFEQFAERNKSQTARLWKNEGLLSDVLALASYSPLLAATLIQNPEYISWLSNKRADPSPEKKEDLLESLARFSLTNSSLEPHVMLARFRRRELLRIFLRDIRRLDTIAEITEEISDLADIILDHAVRLARQEVDNRYGPPFETDEKGRQKPSDVCIVSLGKLGSKELNYASDIDLLFIYTADGKTTGTGTREPVTNREYFAKFAEAVTGLVGRQTGEGAAYRVDMRLRPHGRVGALALSLKETVRYYLTEARSWEQQVLIRSRASAGDAELYRTFFSQVEEAVFRKDREPGEALAEVFRSKEKINRGRISESAFNVKLGRGGIREIEFIAQALQLAHGGEDRWLRVSHTLISISRLADRGYLTERERSALSNAYDFLRRLEHILQMEHGLQTHSLPVDPEKADIVAARMRFSGRQEFEAALAEHTGNVHNAFLRVFGRHAEAEFTSAGGDPSLMKKPADRPAAVEVQLERQILASAEKHGASISLDADKADVIQRFSAVSPHFAELIASRPQLIEDLHAPATDVSVPDYEKAFAAGVDIDAERPVVLRQMRSVWSRCLLEIAEADVYGTLSAAEIRGRQTLLAEASIAAAARAAVRRFGITEPGEASLLAVLALGKLGSGTLDYGSDLDLVMAYDDAAVQNGAFRDAEVYSRAVELFVTFLSAITREGNLYRVDLRLRPHGKNGPNVTSISALIDYIEADASVWELLAYVQMRAVRTGTDDTAAIDAKIREALKKRASREDPDAVKRSAREMRLRLEKTHAPHRRDVDIKFGPGGLLDVYFIVRAVVLSHLNMIPDEARSTAARLDALHAAGLLQPDDHLLLREGHAFLSALDHGLRFTFGRSSRFPKADHAVLSRIAARMGLSSEEELNQQLALHRMNVRAVFDRVLAA